MKQTIKLTESKLRNIIKECVKKTLCENNSNFILKNLYRLVDMNGGSLDVDGGVYIEKQTKLVMYDDNTGTSTIVDDMSEEELDEILNAINSL